MKLYAISDLHLINQENRDALETIPAHPEDWLILAGDIGETADLLQFALQLLNQRFAQLIWVPGNHDLWTLPNDETDLRGRAKYDLLVSICRRYGVLTPEDPYARWTGAGSECFLAPTFTLYDYSFRPDDVPYEKAVDWAAETEVVCTDEYLLHPEPYGSFAEWCSARCDYTESRLKALPPTTPIVLINHYPLREDMLFLKRIPRFSLWCGTKRTEHWHLRFPIKTVVYGHIHIPATHWRNGVQFEEVSFGYPRQRDPKYGTPWDWYLREILPGAGNSPLNR